MIAFKKNRTFQHYQTTVDIFCVLLNLIHERFKLAQSLKNIFKNYNKESFIRFFPVPTLRGGGGGGGSRKEDALFKKELI